MYFFLIPNDKRVVFRGSILRLFEFVLGVACCVWWPLYLLGLGSFRVCIQGVRVAATAVDASIAVPRFLCVVV